MKHILILLFLFSFSSAWALPECKKYRKVWNNCIGSFSYPNGDIYTGEWKQNKQYGQGTYSWATGHKYIGNFKKNNRHGYGKLIFPNGGEYIGEFKDGKKHGQGALTIPNGKVYDGLWRNDKFIGTKENEDGSIKLAIIEDMYQDKLIKSEGR